jgi:hypothetical protein
MCLSFEPTPLAFEAAAKVPSFSHLITARALPFIVHKTDEDFTLVTGPKVFVEAAVGASLGAARTDWRRYASHRGWNASERAKYTQIADWYSEFS